MMNDNCSMLSVVIPIYNMENYLHDCINSVLRQTIQNFELLLIDDGSIDASGDICDEYAANDPRVRVFHKLNGGVTSARLYGVENAIGEWIGFVDADDMISPTYYRDLFAGCSGDNCLLVCSSFENAQYSRNDFVKGLLLNRIDWRLPSKLYHRSLFKRNILRVPPDIYIGEDLLTNLSASHFVDKVSMVKNNGYYYRCNANSAIHRREWNLEYEEYFLRCVEASLDSEMEMYADEFWHFQVNTLKNLVINGRKYNNDWIINLKKDKRGKKLSVGEVILLHSPNFYIAYFLLRFLKWMKNIINVEGSI